MVRDVAVVGAGVMGHGIAQLFAAAGASDRLHDVDEARLDAGLRAVDESLALLVEEGVTGAAEAAATRSRIRPTTDLEGAVRGAEAVTECVTELLEVKRELFRRVEAVLAQDALLFSNTSTLPVARLAEGAAHPDRIAVTHYFNPAQLVPLVEVLTHPSLPVQRVDRTLGILRAIGKHPVLLRRDVPGFVANRLQAALVREAFHLVESGVAGWEDVDAVVTEGPGARWPFVGPIATADLGGLDVWRRVIDNLAPELGRAEGAPASIRDRVERGELGAKTGRGIYAYPGGRGADRVRERDRALVRLARLKKGLPP
jgi:3-hydroxyacyl-CoA dehydrogenase